MEKEINIPEVPECRFFIQDNPLENIIDFEIGMLRNGKKYGVKILTEWDSKIYGKIDLSTLTHREKIIGCMIASLQSELVSK